MYSVAVCILLVLFVEVRPNKYASYFPLVSSAAYCTVNMNEAVANGWLYFGPNTFRHHPTSTELSRPPANIFFATIVHTEERFTVILFVIIIEEDHWFYSYAQEYTAVGTTEVKYFHVKPSPMQSIYLMEVTFLIHHYRIPFACSGNSTSKFLGQCHVQRNSVRVTNNDSRSGNRRNV